MKNWVRVIALSLVLAMVLGVSAAYADAYTVPKTLKDVAGLPENPEVPTMKTKNDGKTETVTLDGQLASLSANWDNELFALDVKDGTATFDISGRNLQLGCEGKSTWYFGDVAITKVTKLDKTHYDYSITKNDDGTFTVVEEPYTEIYGVYSGAADADLKYPTDKVVEKGSYKGYASSKDYYYTETKTPYTAVRNPGYVYWYPVSGLKDRERYYIDPDTRDPETGKVIKFDDNGNYIIIQEEYKSPNTSGDNYIDSEKMDAAIEKAIQEKIDVAVAEVGEETEPWGWMYYDDDGYSIGMYHVATFVSWAQDINGYGKAFEGKTTDGVIVGYNRKGEACEKIIEMPAGTDFFASETAPSKVTVTWLKGKSSENKTVWYISNITQEYANETVRARFAQGGKNIGIKKTAK